MTLAPVSLRSSLRIAGYDRGPLVRLTFDGADVDAYAGEMLASALFAAGIRVLRKAPVDGGPRGMFCAMGSCQECAVIIDGQRVEACRMPVTSGMEVRSIP